MKLNIAKDNWCTYSGLSKAESLSKAVSFMIKNKSTVLLTESMTG